MTAQAMSAVTEAERPSETAEKSPIQCKKLGHYVYEVTDIQRTLKFWTEVMNFTITDWNEHGMVFLRCAADHHGIGLKPGKAAKRATDGNVVEHLAFEVDSMDVLFQARDYFHKHNIPIVFEGRKGAGWNTSINFCDPDGYQFEIYYSIDQVGPDGRLRPDTQFRRAKSLEEAAANPVPERW
jgi:catechol 2,3-dioxygenase-like lactoylglutathione lyase family enzyme